MNARPSQATDEAPNARLPREAERGGPLPASAADYGFLLPGRVGAEALVAVLGNQYSVPVAHVGAPVTVRVHRARIALWRDTTVLAEHARAPDGAHRRVVIPDHFAPLFGAKPRAQVMLYREALMQLGEGAARYLSELSCRQRASLRREILAVQPLLQQHGAAALLAAMATAEQVNAYGPAYLHTLLQPPAPPPLPPPPLFPPLALPGVPPQAEIDRQLSLYEPYVQGAGTPMAGRAAEPPVGVRP